MKRIFRLFFCLLLVGHASAKLPLIIAHRGASHEAPENTMAAFKLAWEENADGIEGDFYLSADGEVVCFHDKDLKRVAGVDRIIEDMSWAELSRVDVGSWKNPKYKNEKMPRLGEVLDGVPAGKYFFIEIKSGPEIVPAIRKILLDRKPDRERVILIAFSAEVIRECRKLIPEYKAHWLSSLKDADQPGKAAEYLRELESTGAQGFQFHWKAPIAPEWLKSLKGKSYTLTSWTVNDPVAAKAMIERGVDFITTDRPEGLRGELE